MLEDGTTGGGTTTSDVDEIVRFRPKLAPGTGVGVTSVVGIAELLDPDELAVARLDDAGAEGVAGGGGGVGDGGGGGAGAAPRASRGPPVTGSRYQLTGGSPRHSPSGTRSYFSSRALSIMNCANWWTVKSWTSCASEIQAEVAGLCWERIVWYVFLALTPPFSQSRVSIS